MVTNYFQELFKDPRRPDDLSLRLEALIAKKVSRNNWDDLIKPVSNEEVKATFFDMAKDKTPGPDGYNTNFFCSTWSIIGKDVCLAIKDFFCFW